MKEETGALSNECFVWGVVYDPIFHTQSSYHCYDKATEICYQMVKNPWILSFIWSSLKYTWLKLTSYQMVKADFSEIGNKARILTFDNSIQHCSGGYTHCNKARKGHGGMMIRSDKV